MGAYGSVAAGYDPGYLLRESTKGAEGYYLSAVAEIGEPPGVWTGRACPQLGLATGGEVEPAVMEAIYGELLDPRDPAFTDQQVPADDKAHLGPAPRRYKTAAEILAASLAAEPGAGPERAEQLEIAARKQARSAVLFFDYTFSVDKTTSLLHASLQAAAVRAERAGDAGRAAEFARLAGEVEAAVMAGAAAAVDYLQDEAGYSRAGYHGGIPRDEQGRPLAQHATGRWVDAHDWVVAAFLQHTSRDGDPQLHVHNPILNRAQCADGTWRTLDSRAVHKARAAATAIGGRVMDERISRTVTVAYAQRPDLHGRELAGFPAAVKDKFSSRRTAITAGVAELAAQYTARHGKPPPARALFSMAQYVTLQSRRAKPKHEHAVPRAVTLAGWEAEMRAAELGALADIPAALIGRLDPAAAPGAALGEQELRRVTAAAVADVQAARAVWGRSHLLAAIDAHLPGWLGGLDAAQVRAVLEELTDRALAPESGHGVVNLEAPELAETPASLRRADGRSVYSPHDRALYTTRPQLDAEERLLAAAGEHGGPRTGAQEAAAALGGAPADLASLPGRVLAPASLAEAPPAPAGGPARRWADGLRDDQAAAVWGILTSGRPVDILVGPAGTGKSRTMGTLSQLWPQLTGGAVVGVATAENAAQVLAAEGVGTAYNIARFLAITAAGRTLLGRGDLLIVDEASMVDTAQLAALHQIAAAAGAKLLLTGDPAQLQAVGAGGVLAMLARQYGCYQLTTVQRMVQEWERRASLRLRAGDTTVLADYDRRGRIRGGTAEQMTTAAYRAWLADHLAGKDTLLIAATTDQAAELAGRAREDLVVAGHVQPGGIALRDGNTAGVGDLVQARRNDRGIRDQDGRWAANRDIWRIEGYARRSRSRTVQAIVRRDLGRDSTTGERRWSGEFEVPGEYLREDAELAYAGTVHAAEGRTVDTCHALAQEGLTRALLYVALTRGREANYAYVITDTPSGRRPPHVPDADQAGQRVSADLRPGTQPAAALATPTGGGTAPEDQAAAGPAEGQDPDKPWAPEADRLSVLIGALEREDTELPALQVLEDELARARHLAHLGAIWSDLAAEESARRYDATVRQALTPEHYQRYAADPARGTLHRLVRTAELAGHDPDALLTSAVRMRSLDNAPGRGAATDIAKVLHSRVEELAGRPVPRPAGYTARTPATAADPEIGRYLRELGRLMDEQVTAAGERAATDPPAWALEHLGPVPADDGERDAWVRRAGAVAAYREHYGRSDPADLIGREPAAPDARADWHAARAALGTPAAEAAVASASTGELHARRARYEREMAWAPPHVGADLRRTALARREHATEATLARARAEAADVPERGRLRARSAAHDQLARQLAAREQTLAGIDTQRARWHEATAPARQQAQEATAELHRRRPDERLPELGGRQPMPERERAHERAQPASAAAPPQRETTDADLRRAAEMAELARGILDAREARARQRAEREARREREEPAPQRWPHRDPGYRARPGPQPDRNAAELAAQAFPGGLRPPPLSPEHATPAEPEPGRRPPEPGIERDGPEASL
jgi:hypothetical protein